MMVRELPISISFSNARTFCASFQEMGREGGCPCGGLGEVKYLNFYDTLSRLKGAELPLLEWGERSCEEAESRGRFHAGSRY